MITEEQRKILNNEKTELLVKLRLAVASNLVVSERKDKPNLPGRMFRNLLGQIPSGTQVNQAPRMSRKGPYGSSGEDIVFSFTFGVSLLGRTKSYYVKGFFFHKGQIEGVYLQSFRCNKLRMIG